MNLNNKATADNLQFDEQEASIRAIKKVSPAVVSIIVYDEEEFVSAGFGGGMKIVSKEKIQKGSGTGFLISSDGFILTNKHVVSSGNEKTAEFRIIMNSGKKYYAQFIGKDPLYDFAILKIFDKDLPYVELGNSDKLEIGTSVMAIGNALGIYRNSVTKGIISGLERNLTASDGSGYSEDLSNVLQTDAEINLGNSGGPLIDLNGKVVGVNVAVDQTGTAIGFAIPINDTYPIIRSVREIGRIIRPRLGVRHIMIDQEVVEQRKTPINYGALVLAGEEGSVAVLPDSPAGKAGVMEGDIIFEVNAIKLERKNTLLSVLQKYKVGDKIGLKIRRGDKVLIKTVVLDEFKVE